MFFLPLFFFFSLSLSLSQYFLSFPPTFPSYNVVYYSSCCFLSRSSLHIPHVYTQLLTLGNTFTPLVTIYKQGENAKSQP